jgi:cytochrome c-type biogenesis protein CcmH/NrfG
MDQIAERASQQQLPSAAQWANQSLKVAPNAGALCVLASIAARSGNYTAAFTLVDQAVKLFPSDTKPLCVRAYLNLLQGDLLKERNDLQKALQQDASNKSAAYMLAETYFPEGKDWYTMTYPLKETGESKVASEPELVLKLVSPLLSDDKFIAANPNALALSAAASLKLGGEHDANKISLAIKQLERFVNLKADDSYAWKLLSQAYAKNGDSKRSASCLARSTQLAQQKALSLTVAARTMSARHEDRYALGLIKHALDLDANCDAAWTTLQEMARHDNLAKSCLSELSSASPAAAKAAKQEQQSSH